MDQGRRRDRITKRLTKKLDRSRILRSSGPAPEIKDCTFAVLDVETTGIGNDAQVIEIGLVRFTADGQGFDEWGTLVNPGRDLSSYRIHQLKRFEYVRHAPTFEDIAGDLCARLTGTVMAAHNLTFDRRMVSLELERLGFELPTAPAVCTMQLGSALGVPHRRLEDCCTLFGIQAPRSHTAIADAQVASQLLALYLVTCQGNGVRTLRDLGCEEEIPPAERWPQIPPSGLSYLREVHDGQQKTFLRSLVARLPKQGEESEVEYLGLLDRVLEDFLVTPQEAVALQHFASAAGISPLRARDLHMDYLRALVDAAWEDHVLTREETNEICLVANMLGVSYLDVSRLIDEGKPQIDGDAE